RWHHRADLLPLAQGVWRVAGRPGSAAEGTGARERQAEAVGVGVEPGEAGVKGHRLGKLLSPERRRCAVDHAQEQGMSERRGAVSGAVDGRPAPQRTTTTLT